MSAILAKLSAILGKSVAWILAHKSEIASFLAAGALAVTPEKYQGIAQSIAMVAGLTTATKYTVNAAVAQHVEDEH